MNDVTYTYTLCTAETGRPTTGFAAVDPPQMLYSCPPDPERQSMYARSDLTETVVENLSAVRMCSTNTKHVPLETTSMLHTEGGWPATVAPNESEAKWKYVEKFERNECYVSAWHQTAPSVINALRENNTLDFYEWYSFDAQDDEARQSLADLNPQVPALKIHSVFSGDSGQIVDVAWSPAGRVAIASTSESKIWDVDSPVAPAAYLNPAGLAAYVSCLAFSSKDVNIVAGGSSAGVVQWWDKREGDMPVQHTPPAISHNQEVLSIKWSSAKSGEAVTCALDGKVKIWDMRQLSTPLENNTLSLDIPDTLGGASAVRTLGGTVLDHTPLVGSSKFLVGTQEGFFLSCSRADGKEPVICKTYTAHHGPVYSLTRCPSHPELILSAGDWRCVLWREDLDVPVWTTSYCESVISAAAWHPTLPGLFCALRMDGCIEVWNLIRRESGVPALTAKLSKNPLCSLAIHSEGRYLAVGDTAGSLYIASFQEFEAHGAVSDSWAEGLKQRKSDDLTTPRSGLAKEPVSFKSDGGDTGVPASPRGPQRESIFGLQFDEVEDARARYATRVDAARKAYQNTRNALHDVMAGPTTSPIWNAVQQAPSPRGGPRGLMSPIAAAAHPMMAEPPTILKRRDDRGSSPDKPQQPNASVFFPF